MADAIAARIFKRDWIWYWDSLRNVSKQIVAAVSGYVFGGGSELALACDMIVASEIAKFEQPEINLGIIPSPGSTQRLTRALGKSKGMELILTGCYLSPREAEASGIVARVVPVDNYLDEAMALAPEIASKPLLAVSLAKDSVNKAFELLLREGLDYKRKLFYFHFSTQNQTEGMRAFIDKRKPVCRSE